MNIVILGKNSISSNNEKTDINKLSADAMSVVFGFCGSTISLIKYRGVNKKFKSQIEKYIFNNDGEIAQPRRRELCAVGLKFRDRKCLIKYSYCSERSNNKKVFKWLSGGFLSNQKIVEIVSKSDKKEKNKVPETKKKGDYALIRKDYKEFNDFDDQVLLDKFIKSVDDVGFLEQENARLYLLQKFQNKKEKTVTDKIHISILLAKLGRIKNALALYKDLVFDQLSEYEHESSCQLHSA